MSILETSERAETFFSCLGVVTFFLGLPLFLLLSDSEGASSASCEASSITLSSLSDSKGSVDAMLAGFRSSADAVEVPALFGLPGVAVSALKSLAGVLVGVFLAGVFLMFLDA